MKMSRDESCYETLSGPSARFISASEHKTQSSKYEIKERSPSLESKETNHSKLLEEIHKFSKCISGSEDSLDNLTILFLKFYDFGLLISESKSESEVEKYFRELEKFQNKIIEELVKNKELLQEYLSKFHLVYGIRCPSSPDLRCKLRSGIEFLLDFYPTKQLYDIFNQTLIRHIDRFFSDGILQEGEELKKPNLLPISHWWWNTSFLSI